MMYFRCRNWMKTRNKKKVFAGNWSVFSPKLGEKLDLFCLIIQNSNLDGGHLNLDGETLTLDGGTRRPCYLSTARAPLEFT